MVTVDWWLVYTQMEYDGFRLVRAALLDPQFDDGPAVGLEDSERDAPAVVPLVAAGLDVQPAGLPVSECVHGQSGAKASPTWEHQSVTAPFRRGGPPAGSVPKRSCCSRESHASPRPRSAGAVCRLIEDGGVIRRLSQCHGVDDLHTLVTRSRP